MTLPGAQGCNVALAEFSTSSRASGRASRPSGAGMASRPGPRQGMAGSASSRAAGTGACRAVGQESPPVGDENPFGRRQAGPDRAASPVAEMETGNINAVSTKRNDVFGCASAHDNRVPPPPGTPGL